MGLAHVNRRGVHHDLHHAQACYAQAPQHFSCVFAAHFVGQRIVGWHRAVTKFRNRLHPIGGSRLVGRPHHPAPVTGRTDLGRLHTRHRHQSFFNVDGASRAVHAFKHNTGGPLMGFLLTGLAEIRPLLRKIQQ